MVKLLFMTGYLPPTIIGASYHSYHLMSQLVRYLDELHVLYYENDSCIQPDVPKGAILHSFSSHENTNPFEFARLLSNIVKSSGINVMHVELVVHELYPVLIPLLLKRETKKPTLVNLCNLWSDFINVDKLDETLKIEKILLKESDCVTAISKQIKEDYERYHLSVDIEVVPRFVNTEKFSRKKKKDLGLHERFNIPSDKKIVLFVGSIAKRKGIEILLKSAKKLDAEFVLVGPMQQDCLSYLPVINKLPNVRWVGPVTNEEMPSYYTGSDVLVIPSYYDYCPNVLLEAMACGCPVISTKLPGIMEYVKNNRTGVLVKPGQVEDLKNSIITLLYDSKLRNELIQNAIYEIRNKYSLQANIPKVVNNYERLAKL
ncbi:MAG: glycosyltransferase family 4 protein [Candidatus Altiarchaeota archaeon]